MCCAVLCSNMRLRRDCEGRFWSVNRKDETEGRKQKQTRSDETQQQHKNRMKAKTSLEGFKLLDQLFGSEQPPCSASITRTQPKCVVVDLLRVGRVRVTG